MRTLKFSIDDIELFREDEDVDFAIAKLYFIGSGDNSHNNPISEEVLRKCANTALGKFVVGKFEKWSGDVTTHVNDEVILGYIPPNSEIAFEEKDNKLFAVANAVISKVYATDVYQIFKKDNLRSVSSEFSCTTEFDEDKIPPGSRNPILSFSIHGVTILGKKVNPSVKGAEMSMVKFSEKEAETFYDDFMGSKIKKFASERKKKMESKSYKVNKTELKETPWGEVNKADMRKKIMEASNKDSLVKDVYMMVESGWEEAPSEHLKYPVMQLVGDTFYYNRGGLASALGYAKKEGASKVVSKVEKLYDKFDLDKEEGDKKMETKEFSQLEGREIYGAVIERVHKKLGNHFYVEEIYSDHVEVRDMTTKEMYDIPAKIKLGKDDEEMSIEIDYDKMKKSTEQKQFAKKMDDDEDDDDDKDEDKDKGSDEDNKNDDDEDEAKDNDDDDDKKMEKNKGKKKFSLDVNADVGAYLEMLENETEDYRELANELWESKDLNLIMSKYMAVVKERDELKKFKQTKEDEAKQFEIDKTMGEVKGDLTQEKFDELKGRGMECKFSELEGWKNTVKAFAYEASKNKKVKKQEKEVMKYAMPFANVEPHSAINADEIYKKYL
ncbi:MAG: hypothetical protein ACRCX8_15765 [Sarcina sp.]